MRLKNVGVDWKVARSIWHASGNGSPCLGATDDHKSIEDSVSRVRAYWVHCVCAKERCENGEKYQGIPGCSTSKRAELRHREATELNQG